MSSPQEPDRFSRLVLERLDPVSFRCGVDNIWKPKGARGVFGGQILALCLEAAQQTVEDTSKALHSMHCYFVRAGRTDVPIICRVRTIREGKSFSTRVVRATQDGHVILVQMASFQRHERSGAEFQCAMPDVSRPDELPESSPASAPFDTRWVLSSSGLAPEGIPRPPAGTARQLMWIRCRRPLINEASHHMSVLAYASDWALLMTAAPRTHLQVGMTASLDHTMWFHAPFRADEWLLYDMDATRFAGARGLVHGKIYRQDGTLAVSVTQEGLIRYLEDREASGTVDSKL